MRIFIVLTTLAVAAVPCASAQQSLFQSGNGQSAVYLRQSTAAINLGDSKASIGYIHRVNTQPFSWGAEAYATANAGVASLFSSSKPTAPEGGGDGTLVKHYLLTKPPAVGVTSPSIKEDSLILDVGYGRSSFYVYPTSSTPSTSTAKTDFDRFRTILSYNIFSNGDTIFGLAAGAERRNNLANLKATTEQTVVDAGSAGSTTTIVKTQTGYYGNYKVYVAAPIYMDYLRYLPAKAVFPGFDNRIGIDLFTRADVAAVNRGASGGIGFFLFKKADPLSSIGGITASYDGTSFTLSLVAGITSGK